VNFDPRLIEFLRAHIHPARNLLFLGLSQQEATEISSRLHIPIRYICESSDFNKELDSIDPESFDAVAIVNTLYLVPQEEDIRVLAHKIARTLRPEGTLLLLEPNARAARDLLQDSGHAGVGLSHRGVAQIFAEAGLNILEVKPRFLPVSNGGKLTHLTVESEWFQMLFGARYLIKARRSQQELTSTAKKAVERGEAEVRHYVFLCILLLLGLFVRLYHVTHPPNDGPVWRQTQTLMMARQYYESRLNIFFPQVYWRTLNEAPIEGYVGGTELNVTPFLTALLYYIFGVQDWVGRVFPIIFSIVGLAYFHRIVARFCSLRTALFSTTLLCFAPMYLFLGRVQMPESLTFCMIFMTVYYFDRWLEGEGYRLFPHAAASCAGMLLAKPQTAYMAIPLAFLVLNRDGFRTIIRPRYYLFLTVVLPLCSAFYIWSFVLLPGYTGISLQSRSIFRYGFHFLRQSHFYTLMWSRALSSPVGTSVTLLGLLGFLVPGRRLRDWFPHVFLLASVLSIFYMPGMHYHNPYYQTLFVPPLAMLGGKFLNLLARQKIGKILSFVLLIFALATSLQAAKEFFSVKYYSGDAYSRCGTWIREHSTPEDRVIVAAEDPSTLYFADRMGWICRAQHDGKPIMFSKELIGRLMPLGASIVAIPEIFSFDTYTKQRGDAGKLRDYLYDSFKCHREDNFAVFFLKEPADLVIPPSGIIDCNDASAFKYLRGSWGPRFLDRYGTGYIHKDKGAAQVKFVARRQITRIDMVVSGEKDGGIVTARVNGRPYGEYTLPKAWKRYTVSIALDRPLERGETVEIDVDIRYPSAIESQRFLLWQIEAL